MEVDVHLQGTLGADDSGELDAFADGIANFCPSLKRTTLSVPGVKDGGLTVGLSIAGLALSALSTIISALAYWRSTRPQYSVSIRDGAAEYTMDNLSKEGVADLAKKIDVHGPKGSLLVRIFRA